MNKNLIAGLIVAVLVVGGFLLSQQGRGEVDVGSTTQEVPVDPNSGVEEMVVEENTQEPVESGGIREVVVRGENFSLTPTTLNFNPGERVRLTFKSTGGMHDFVLEDQEVATKRVNTGQEDTIEFTVPEEIGTYTFYCSVGNHRALGMEGRLVVE